MAIENLNDDDLPLVNVSHMMEPTLLLQCEDFAGELGFSRSTTIQRLIKVGLAHSDEIDLSDEEPRMNGRDKYGRFLPSNRPR
jgi:hypothetical protein